MGMGFPWGFPLPCTPLAYTRTKVSAVTLAYCVTVLFTSSLFSVRAIDDMCRDKVDDDVIRKVERIVELVMIRDNMLQLSSNVLV